MQETNLQLQRQICSLQKECRMRKAREVCASSYFNSCNKVAVWTPKRDISANCSFVRRPLRFFVCNWGCGDWKACLIGLYGAFVLGLSTQSTFSHSELKHFEPDLRVQRRRQRKLRFQYLAQWYLEMHAGGTREWTERQSTLTVLNDQVNLQRHSQLFKLRLYFITNTFNMGSTVAQWLALSLHSKKSCVWLHQAGERAFCVELVVSVSVLALHQTGGLSRYAGFSPPWPWWDRQTKDAE